MVYNRPVNWFLMYDGDNTHVNAVSCDTQNTLVTMVIRCHNFANTNYLHNFLHSQIDVECAWMGATLIYNVALPYGYHCF